jgi:hypothetical protein
MGDLGGCLKDLDQALASDNSPDTLLATSQILGRVMPFAARAPGREIRKMLESLGGRLPKEDFGMISKIARLRLRGEVLLARGDGRAALEEFAKADKLEAPTIVAHNYRSPVAHVLYVFLNHLNEFATRVVALAHTLEQPKMCSFKFSAFRAA